jgi:hypothetical protein
MIEKPIADNYWDQLALINPEKPLKVYRNLNRNFNGEKGFWSVRQGTVKFHCRTIFLKNVTFPVNERVRLEVVQNGVKKVHAYVEGFLTDRPTFFTVGVDCHEVTYNPYKNRKFVCRRGEVKAAQVCGLTRRYDGKMRVYANSILTEAIASDTIETVAVHLL